ncbi:MAG: glutamate-5-semialdehyde dehydrogenase [Pseudomonadota bacterium]
MNIASRVTAHPKTPPSADADIGATMRQIGTAARSAAATLALSPTAVKRRALIQMADALRTRAPVILEANQADMADAEQAGRPAAFLDRLALNDQRIAGMAQSLHEIAELEDPVGRTIAEWERPNGLQIARVRQPLGVIGVIYESRPNVTSDAAALCLFAGNACILRSGADSLRTARAIEGALHAGLAEAGLPIHAVQVVPVPDRDAVGLMLSGLDGAIDVIVPRGGRSLVERIEAEARVPVFAHLDGNCHVYLHADADPEMAKTIVVNAKMRRTGICGAAETLLVDRGFIDDLPGVLHALIEAGCTIRGDGTVRELYDGLEAATADDWATEFLDAIIAVRVVDDMDGALVHIATYGSGHTEAIITEDHRAAEVFLAKSASAITLWNASTQFADGGEFGMGAEIGIATGKLHARGPVGIEQLTTFRYVVRGSGQVRP